MTHPYELAARTAAWSLHNARQRLTALADAEAADIAAERLEAADGLRSTTYGQRHATGGHSDPVSGLLLATHRPARVNRWADMVARLDGRLRWLADQLPTAPAGPDAWWRLYDALPRLQPGTLAVLAKHLTDENIWVRAATGLAPDRQPLTGNPPPECPGCHVRRLEVQTSGPREAWVVVCAAGCHCGGPGCGCGMPGAVEGAPHIWLRDTVIGASAGDAPTRTGGEAR